MKIKMPLGTFTGNIEEQIVYQKGRCRDGFT